MKTFEVKFQQTTYTRVRVKAHNIDQAIDKAYKKIDDAEYIDTTDPDISTVYEVKG
jgi:hypothetical protein